MSRSTARFVTRQYCAYNSTLLDSAAILETRSYLIATSHLLGCTIFFQKVGITVHLKSTRQKSATRGRLDFFQFLLIRVRAERFYRRPISAGN
jgi:hypothetical protein